MFRLLYAAIDCAFTQVRTPIIVIDIARCVKLYEFMSYRSGQI